MGPNLIGWLIVGAIAGYLGGMVMKTRLTLLGSLIIGIIGAIVGGGLISLTGSSLGIGGGLVEQIVVATLGSIVLLFVLAVASKKRL